MEGKDKLEAEDINVKHDPDEEDKYYDISDEDSDTGKENASSSSSDIIS